MRRIFPGISPAHLGKCPHAFPPALFFTLSDQQGNTRRCTCTRLGKLGDSHAQNRYMTMSIRVVMNIIAATSREHSSASVKEIRFATRSGSKITSPLSDAYPVQKRPNYRVPCQSPNARYTAQIRSASIEFEVSCISCMESSLRRRHEDSLNSKGMEPYPPFSSTVLIAVQSLQTRLNSSITLTLHVSTFRQATARVAGYRNRVLARGVSLSEHIFKGHINEAPRAANQCMSA